MSRESENRGLGTATFDLARINKHLLRGITYPKCSLSLIDPYFEYLDALGETLSYTVRRIVYKYLDYIDVTFQFVNFSHLVENAINYIRVRDKIAREVLKERFGKKEEKREKEKEKETVMIPGRGEVEIIRRLE